MDNQENNDINSQLSTTDILLIALNKYHAGLNLIASRAKTLSNRGLRRAFFAAIDHGVTNSNFTFQSKDEAEVAGLLAHVLDMRNVILADKLNKQSVEPNSQPLKEETNGESKNEEN